MPGAQPHSLYTRPNKSGTGQDHPYIQFGWHFNSGTQTHYNVVVERNDTGAVVYDSGQVVAEGYAGVPFLTPLLDLTAVVKEVTLRWKVRIWSDGTAGSFSLYNLFTFSDPPAVTITAPTGSIGNPRPMVQWSISSLAAGKTIVAGTMLVERWNGAFYVAQKSISLPQASLGTTGGSYTPTEDLYSSGSSYRTIITLIDNYGLSGSDPDTLTASWTTPVAPEFWVAPWMNRQVDLFTRADHATIPGGTWQGINDSFGITSNSLYKSTATAINRSIALNTAAESRDIDIRLTQPSGSGSYVAIVARYTDLNNYLFFEAAPSNAVVLYKMVNGVWSAIGDTGTNLFQLNQVLRVVLIGTTVRIYQNDVLTATLTDNSGLMGAKAGVMLAGAGGTGGARIDNWQHFHVGPTTYVDSVAVSWTNAEKDATWVRWEVWRYDLTSGLAPVLLKTYTVDQASYVFNDWLYEPNKTYRYSVRQVATRSGANVSSIDKANGVPSEIATPTTDRWWLIHPTDSTYNVLLQRVVDHSFSDETEESELAIIGRGRKIDYGTSWGIRGSLKAQVRDIEGGLTARQQRAALLATKRLNISVYLRNPFGDLWLVAIGNPEMTHVTGGGLREFFDLSLSYIQVS